MHFKCSPTIDTAAPLASTVISSLLYFKSFRQPESITVSPINCNRYVQPSESSGNSSFSESLFRMYLNFDKSHTPYHKPAIDTIYSFITECMSAFGRGICVSYKHFQFFPVFLGLLFGILHIETVINAVRDALLLCAISIIPSLFVFFILSDLIVSILLSNGSFPAPKYWIFLLGTLCGFPTGAVICERLCQESFLEKKSAAKLLPLCNNASPAFVIGAIGTSMFGNKSLGILLYFCGTVSALFLLLPMRIQAPSASGQRKEFSFSAAFFQAVEKAVGSILRICALICFFSALLAVLKKYCPSQIVPFLASLLEIGNGAIQCTSLYATAPVISLILCAFACAWSGVCVHMQIFSTLKSIKVNYLSFASRKGQHAVLTVILTWIGYKIFFST